MCDKCNNYFGRKLEQPVLASDYFQTLRARQALTSRAGNPLLWEGLALTGGGAFRASFSQLEKNIYFESESLNGGIPIGTAMARATGGRLYLPLGVQEPAPKVLSRFFAKIGLEVVAHRLLGSADFSTIVYDTQLDAIRNWARYGSGAFSWPLHRRRLYDENHSHIDDAYPEGYQLLHEFMLLVTDTKEWYSIVCIFGEEFAINLGGPEIEGYEAWLRAHDQQSPLATATAHP